MSLEADYFEKLYARLDDPWRLADRWYELRKRQMTMAVLPRERFTNALEIGCSIGLLTEQLVRRADRLLATDIAPRPLEVAKARLARSFVGAADVEFRLMRAPEEWPTGTFDLILISEVGYYLDEEALTRLAQRCAESLTDDGVVVACHWRHPVEDYPLRGDRVQEVLIGASGLMPIAAYVDADFRLEVLAQHGTTSVAASEGLTP